MEKYKPDSAWLLAVLSVMSPDNEIFKKGYRPPPRKSPAQPLAEMQINNHDDLFTGLPTLSRKELLRGRNNIFLTKEEKIQAKLQAKMLRAQAIQESIAKQQAKLEEIRNPKKTVTISAAEYEEFQQLREAAVAAHNNTGQFGGSAQFSQHNFSAQ